MYNILIVFKDTFTKLIQVDTLKEVNNTLTKLYRKGTNLMVGFEEIKYFPKEIDTITISKEKK